MRNNMNGTLCVPFVVFLIWILQGRSIPLPDSAQPADVRCFFLFLSHFQFAVCRFLQSIPDGAQGLGGIDIG